MPEAKKQSRDELVKVLNGELVMAMGFIAKTKERQDAGDFAPSDFYHIMYDSAQLTIDEFKNAGIDASELGTYKEAGAKAKEILSGLSTERLEGLQDVVNRINGARMGLMKDTMTLEKQARKAETEDWLLRIFR